MSYHDPLSDWLPHQDTRLAFSEALKGVSPSAIAQEGYIRAGAGAVVDGVVGGFSEMKGWTEGVKSKQNHINELSDDLIEWLKDFDKSHPKLNLDAGTIKTWMKTSPLFSWRFYFILHDRIYNDLISDLKKNEITQLEDMTDFSYSDRVKVTRMLESIKSCKDMIVVVEKYRSRVNMVFDKLQSRKRPVKSFPFQVMLLGLVDLKATVKNIVRLAT